MYIRKKLNRSGSISIVVVDKSSGRYRELKTIGVSSDEKEIATFYQQGKNWISVQSGTRRILGGKIGLLFYDVTTLYFETDYSDDFRERGFSTDFTPIF